jgi:tRNA/tmRNA/rRNA uracil-C5-methylase (TrmA/RlmC/RlmD family)
MATPKCAYFGICGGCRLQDVDYGEQVSAKASALSRALGLGDVRTFTGGEYGYRTRMDFSFHPSGLGFRRRGSWREFFDADCCAISNAGVNALLEELRGFFGSVDSYDPVSRSGAFRYAVVRAPPGDSSVSFVLNADSTGKDEALGRVREFCKSTSAAHVAAAYVPSNSDASLSEESVALKGSASLTERLMGGVFEYPIQGFFQNNHGLAEAMHGYCSGLFRGHPTGDAHLLDLYGGAGTFGILNSPLFAAVSIVESHLGSVAAAGRNISSNRASNARAVAMDAKNVGALNLPRPLYAVADPPRGGMHPRALRALDGMSPEAVLYVSCNLGQLVKDLSAFRGYSVRSAALFDFFPQTPHSEAVVELVRG